MLERCSAQRGTGVAGRGGPPGHTRPRRAL